MQLSKRKRNIYRVVVEVESRSYKEILPTKFSRAYLVRTFGSKSAAINTVLKAVDGHEVVSVKAEDISILRVLND
jgi:hypothetical protein